MGGIPEFRCIFTFIFEIIALRCLLVGLVPRDTYALPACTNAVSESVKLRGIGKPMALPPALFVKLPAVYIRQSSRARTTTDELSISGQPPPFKLTYIMDGGDDDSQGVSHDHETPIMNMKPGSDGAIDITDSTAGFTRTEYKAALGDVAFYIITNKLHGLLRDCALRGQHDSDDPIIAFTFTRCLLCYKRSCGKSIHMSVNDADGGELCLAAFLFACRSLNNFCLCCASAVVAAALCLFVCCDGVTFFLGVVSAFTIAVITGGSSEYMGLNSGNRL